MTVPTGAFVARRNGKVFITGNTGWPKGASQLKPSSEHWYLARTGPSTGLNVDGCRVTASGPSPSIARREVAARTGSTPEGANGWTKRNSAEHYTAERPGEAAGRWPPNTLFSHSPGCERVGERRVAATSIHGESTSTRNAGGAWEGAGGALRVGRVAIVRGYADPDGTELVEAWRCVDGCPVAELDAQSGESTSAGGQTNRRSGWRGEKGCTRTVSTSDDPGFGDTGTTSRFFPCFPADDPGAPFAYIAKPSRADRNAGVCVDPQPRRRRNELLPGDCYSNDRRNGNHHPTVKPVALMRWLVRLVTEPGDIVLDPFGGSGTTGVAALLEGRRVILCERDPEYAAIARQRCEAAEAEALRAAHHPREMQPRPRVPNGGVQEFSVLVRAPYATPPEGA